MITKIKFWAILILFASNYLSIAQMINEKDLIIHYPFDSDGKDLRKIGKALVVDDTPQKMLFSWTSDKEEKPNSALNFISNFTGFKPGLNVSPRNFPEITFSAWVYGRPNGYLFGTIVPINESAKIISRCLLFADDCVEAGYMMYNPIARTDQASYLRSSSLPEDQWNFIALSINANDSSMVLYAGNEYYKIYKNDLPVKVFHTLKSGDLIIGNSTTTSALMQFRGKVDDIKIFRKALSPAELKELSGITFEDSRIRIEREKLINQILIIFLLLFFVFMIVFAAIIIFKEKKVTFDGISKEELDEFVKDAKSSPDISATNELAYKYIEDSFNMWPEVNRNGDDIFRAPRKRKEILNTYIALEKARKLKPTEKYIIDRMNELGGICNNLSKRRFYANKFLPIAASILPIIFILIEASNKFTFQTAMTIIVLMLPIIAYIITGFAPTYLVANRKHGSGGILSILIGAIIGAGSAELATEYYNKITWSDGSKTVEYDTGSNLASLIFGILMILAALLLSFILTGIAAIISFFRNFVFYR